ncbi:MAG: hypothetical protein J7K85_02065 [Anaerolineaceae bacterium]|nr:hypothetical protein [Anaerolineaceae bacterium]
MNSRQRLLAALKCEETDRLPWSPFLAYWWEFQSRDLQERGKFSFLKEVGADALLRGYLSPFTIEQGGDVIIRNYSADGLQWEVMDTPLGALRTGNQYSCEGDTTFVVQHPVKKREDYRILRYIIRHLSLLPNYEAVQEQITMVGDDGLCMPLIAPFGKTGFQSLLEHYVGTEQLIYDLIDYPEEIEETLELMADVSRRAVEIGIDSPAEAFISWEDSSTTNVSPKLFKKYIAPEINEWGTMLHQAGKLMIHHACGHLKALLPIMAQEAVDAIESISPPPTGNVEIWDAKEVLGKKMCVVGGVEPVQFETLDDNVFVEYVRELIRRMPERGFILANSDSCPPGVKLERFAQVTEIVREMG